MSKKLSEKLEQMKLRQKQLAAQIHEAESKLREQDRKARTHRLIEVGASVESVLGEISHDELPALIGILKELDNSGLFDQLHSEEASNQTSYVDDTAGFFEEE